MKTNAFIKSLFILVITGFAMNIDAQVKKTRNTKTIPEVQKIALPKVSYTVSMNKPWTHLLAVEMNIQSEAMADKTEIAMPVWTPGSYLVREYARQVESFSVSDSAGNALKWAKTNKNTWSIESKGSHELVIRYNVYANELTVRTNELNDRHAFFTPAALLMFPKGFLQIPSTIKVNPYGDWKIATGLPRESENTFHAENYDVLYDSPFEVSNFSEITFNVAGKQHRFVISGDGNYNISQIAKDTAKIVQAAYDIFGELPYKDYTFILNTRGGGGLEHLNSTALQFPRLDFTTKYQNFLTLVAHEYFHCFNVKRIRPDALGPFDYEKENYTKLLWVAEGGTAYYENVLVKRAGLSSAKDFLSTAATQIQSLQDRPGRFESSLEDASFDAWIKYYRPDENGVNNQISYYDKGEIVNFLLDLTIRSDSNGTKSLDDVLRYLYQEFYKKDKNYTPEDYQKVSEMMAGKSLEDFFSRYVRGTAEIDYNAVFRPFGLELVTENAGAKKNAYLGANLAQENEKLLVKSVPKDTPAYNYGLNYNDQILAIDGNRANLTFLMSYLAERKPDEKIRLTVFRFDQLREIEIILGGRVSPSYHLNLLENADAQQKELYNGFFGTDVK